jgi:hypothetical protein
LLREELLDLCSAPNNIWVISRMRLVGLVEVYGGRNEVHVYRILLTEPQEKRPMGRSMHRRDDY